MGVPTSRVRSTGLMELTTDVGGVHFCTAGEELEPWKAGILIVSTPLWPERVKLSVIIFRTRGPVGWLLQSVVFFSISQRRWPMALIRYPMGGNDYRWALLSLVMGPMWSFFLLFSFSFSCSYFLESMEITDTVFF